MRILARNTKVENLITLDQLNEFKKHNPTSLLYVRGLYARGFITRDDMETMRTDLLTRSIFERGVASAKF